MIRPDGSKAFEEFMQIGFLTMKNLKKILEINKMNTSVGYEGDLAQHLYSSEEGVSEIIESRKKSGVKPGSDETFC